MEEAVPVVRAVAPDVRAPFREEWLPALAADTGALPEVRTVCLRSGGHELYGWLEWYLPTSDGYWHARLRFPPAPNKLVPQDNQPHLKHFVGVRVKITVSRQGNKAAAMGSRLRLDQGDLTSTLMPVRLQHHPQEHEFVLAEVDEPPCS
jgi:hypothetical protein